MQLGVFGPVPYYAPRLPRGFPLAPRRYDASRGADSLESGLRIFELADDLGFDCVSVSEHHFAPNQLTPEPCVLAAAMTQRVRNAKISVLGVLLPMADPVRVAEQFAMLDVLSRGRLYPGVFRGTPNELMVFHSNPSESRERYQEAVRLLLKCWTEPEPFGWEGVHYRYRSIAIWPRPVQQPRPPLLVTANSPEAARFAGTHGLDIGLSLGDVDAKLNHIAHYKAAAERAGHKVTSNNVLMRFVAHVAATDEKAREEFAQGGHDSQMDVYRAAHFRALWSAGIGNPVQVELRRQRSGGGGGGLGAGPGMFPSLIGAPDTLLRQVEEFARTTGIGRLELIFTGHTLPEEVSVASMKLFAKEMLPTLQKLDAQPFFDRVALRPDAAIASA